MITLTRKKTADGCGQKRVSIRQAKKQNLKNRFFQFKPSRDKLLVREVQELSENLPSTTKTVFPDPNNLSEFFLIGLQA